MELSQSIVNFISGLLPLYIEEFTEGVWCARSLIDGTLILPLEESEEYENGMVKVYWQGDSSRETVVPGEYIASQAIVRYVELRNIAEKSKETRDEMRHFANHFKFKTGETLCFDMDEDSELFPWIERAVSRLGKEAVIEILKKQIGL